VRAASGAVIALAGAACVAREALPPPPTRHVTDQVGLVTPATREALDARLAAFEARSGHQVVVWIGETLGGVALEDWTARTFAAWGIGRAGRDDGVALFVLARDRRLRIEVGYGLESLLPDAACARIVRAMGERLRAGDPDSALRLGVAQSLTALGEAPADGAARAPEARPVPPPEVPWAHVALGVLVALLATLLFLRHPGLFFALMWMSRGRAGGTGGGRVGGGGFHGGGGRSGGGGASGRW